MGVLRRSATDGIWALLVETQHKKVTNSKNCKTFKVMNTLDRVSNQTWTRSKQSARTTVENNEAEPIQAVEKMGVLRGLGSLGEWFL